MLRRTGWLRKTLHRRPFSRSGEVRIGLALGGGFARAIAHIGILRVFERENIPLHCVTGVSAGAVVGAAFASGATADEIGRIACAMRFGDVARWSVCRLGLVCSERMTNFLARLLKHMRFEDMKLLLGVIATDIQKGEPVIFRGTGDVAPAIRASCSYPGLFRPVEFEGRLLVDGAMSVEVPALLARKMGANRVISVSIPAPHDDSRPHNMFEVVNRCFQIMMERNEESWRRHSDAVIVPQVGGIAWDGFASAARMIEEGERAAEAILPKVRGWLAGAKASRVISPMVSLAIPKAMP